MDDAAAKAGVITTKKAKPTPKRFDDNRSGGNVVPGGNNSGEQRGNNRGRTSSIQLNKEKVDNTPKKIIVRGEMTVGETVEILA